MSRVAQEIARRVGRYLDRLLREASGLIYLIVFIEDELRIASVGFD